MSGGGGGIIIIKSAVRAVAELEVVKDSLPPAQRIHLNSILQKADADWTEHEFHSVLRYIGQAHDCAS